MRSPRSGEAYGEDIERVFGVPVIVPTTPFPVIKLADLYAELEKEFGYNARTARKGDLTTEAEHSLLRVGQEEVWP